MVAMRFHHYCVLFSFVQMQQGKLRELIASCFNHSWLEGVRIAHSKLPIASCFDHSWKLRQRACRYRQLLPNLHLQPSTF